MDDVAVIACGRELAYLMAAVAHKIYTYYITYDKDGEEILCVAPWKAYGSHMAA